MDIVISLVFFGLLFVMLAAGAPSPDDPLEKVSRRLMIRLR